MTASESFDDPHPDEPSAVPELPAGDDARSSSESCSEFRVLVEDGIPTPLPAGQNDPRTRRDLLRASGGCLLLMLSLLALGYVAFDGLRRVFE